MLPGAILVPQRAVQELQATYSVYVVRPDQTVEFRKVTPGPRVGNLMVITAGLSPGDQVVVEGVQKLQNNAPVTGDPQADRTRPATRRRRVSHGSILHTPAHCGHGDCDPDTVLVGLQTLSLPVGTVSAARPAQHPGHGHHPGASAEWWNNRLPRPSNSR